MKALVKLSCRLIEPEETWEHIEPIQSDTIAALASFCIQRLAKLLGEGGILELKSLEAPHLEMTLIPLRRIVDMRVTAEVEEVPAIDLSTDVSKAKEEKQRMDALNAGLRNLINFPGGGKVN